MKQLQRIIVSIAIFLTGALFLAYGITSHPSTILPEKDGGSEMTKTESQLVKQASIGGVKLDGFGNIRLTYTGTPPKDCAT